MYIVHVCLKTNAPNIMKLMSPSRLPFLEALIFTSNYHFNMRNRLAFSI